MNRVRWLLRLGVAGEFIGHGWVGLGRPTAWLPFFHLFGFGDHFAFAAMPLIGTWDICVGLLMLTFPVRALLIWTTLWGVFTALLRPLAGQGGWEFVERAANFGVPLALLLLSARRPNVVPWTLRLTVAGLLIGHGAIGALMHNPAWTAYFNVIGVDPTTVAQYALIERVGWFEMVLGAVVVVQRGRALLLFVCCWKVMTEFLRPLAGEEPGQFIERAASYVAPVALAMLSASGAQAGVLRSRLAASLSVAARAVRSSFAWLTALAVATTLAIALDTALASVQTNGSAARSTVGRVWDSSETACCPQ